MIFCSFEQKSCWEADVGFVPEKRVTVVLSCLRMCVNVDYLISLYDFFVEGVPAVRVGSDKVKSAVGKKMEERVAKPRNG